MSDLRDAFRDAVQDVEAPGLAADAWAEAQVRRTGRRRGMAGGVVLLAAALVAVLVLAPFGRPGGSDPTAAGEGPSSSASALADPDPHPTQGSIAGAPVFRAPALEDEAGLPRLRTLLPEVVEPPPDDAPDLQAQPTERAVLVTATPDGLGRYRLAVLGRDGGWRHVRDLELQQVRDPGNNLSAPLKSGSVSPDGTRVALPQPGSVVVLDVTSGRHVSWPVGNRTNESVAWASDGRVRVQAEDSGEVIDPTTGDATPDPVSEVFGVAGDVSFGRAASGQQVLRTPTGSRPLSVQEFEWSGLPAVLGDRVARAYFGTRPLLATTRVPQGIAVVDIGTGAVSAVFEVGGSERWKACCLVERWLDPAWLVYVSEERRVIALDTRRGETALVSQLWPRNLVDGPNEAVAFGPLL